MATDVKVLTLRYSPAKHEKLVDLKKKSGARSWEDFFLMLAGTELNKKNLPTSHEGQQGIGFDAQ
jgi:hypothetical protein